MSGLHWLDYLTVIFCFNLALQKFELTSRGDCHGASILENKLFRHILPRTDRQSAAKRLTHKQGVQRLSLGLFHRQAERPRIQNSSSLLLVAAALRISIGTALLEHL